MSIKSKLAKVVPTKRTVASVLGSFRQNLKDLEAIAEAKSREAKELQAKADVLRFKAGEADAESDHALRVHAKISELIG